MKNTTTVSAAIFAAAFGLVTVTNVAANADVTSREYKVLLQPSLFQFSSEGSDVASFVQQASLAISGAINRTVSGSAVLEKQRRVTFYDTPWHCTLKQLGYSFRERSDVGQSSGAPSEVTLKFRSRDRYISGFEDVTSNVAGAETKLEADIGKTAAGELKVIYGHSTKADNSRTINEFRDINSQFPGFDDDYSISNSQPLMRVGNLTVHEHVYKGVEIDLGQFDAQMSVTLWYSQTPAGSMSPVVAEASFKYEDPQSHYSRKVVNRALTAFNAMTNLNGWVAPAAMTKTAFVYQYAAGFCQN